MDSELQKFKTDINLIDYAASIGYQVDPKASTKFSTQMRKDSSRINVSLDQNGHWVVYDFDKEAGGSIIDFVQNFNRSKSLGQVRQELRPWVGINPPKPYIKTDGFRNPKPASKDRQSAITEFHQSKKVKHTPFLTTRCIDSEVLLHPRFGDTIRSDKYDNICFIHKDRDGVSTLEKVNANFKGFTSGSGRSGIWYSKARKGDNQIVICESGIDALSYYKIHKTTQSQYCSIGGQLSNEQLDIVERIVQKNHDKSIILAFDNDKAGHQYVEKIRKRCPDAKNVKVHMPKEKGLDWNDVLKNSEKKFSKESKSIQPSKISGGKGL